MKLVLDAIEHGVAASPQVIRRPKRMVARNFSGATFTAALRHKDAAYAVALAESLLPDVPLGRAAVQAYDRAKAYAPDADEAKMIEIVSRPNRNVSPQPAPSPIRTELIELLAPSRNGNMNRFKN